MSRALLALLLLLAPLAGASPVQAGCESWRVTHYDWTGNRTASGTWPRPGTAAHRNLPFGTRVAIGPYRVTIEDRGGMWHDAWVDIYAEAEGDVVDGWYCAEVLR